MICQNTNQTPFKENKNKEDFGNESCEYSFEEE